MIEKEKPKLCMQIQGWATGTDRDRGGGQGTHSGGQRQEEGDRVGGHLKDKHSGKGTR